MGYPGEVMKRHPQLQGLSRDHHHALVLARRAARTAANGSDAEVDAQWAAVAAAFEADLLPHFEVEEGHLLPPLEAAGLTDLVLRTQAEHTRLRALREPGGAPRERLAELGQLLAEHVRFEEGTLFPAAEEALGADALGAIAEASAGASGAASTGRRRTE